MIHFNIPPLSNIARKPITAPKIQHQTMLQIPNIGDYFERTIQKTDKVSDTNFSNEKIEAIYNKTFDIVLKQNPIINELNYQKPKLNFNESKTDKADLTIASYSFLTNEIAIVDWDLFKQDIFLIKYYNENNEQTDLKIIPENKLKECKSKKGISRTEKTKLTDKEKELYLSSIFAHELRHSIQYNILASTKNCDGHIKETVNNCIIADKELLDSMQELLDLTQDKKEKAKIAKELEELKRQNKKIDFSLNYKPKKLFDENMTLKFSIIPDDNRYLSIKKHFYDVDKDKTLYELRPWEIDAYHYEGEFITTQMPEKDSNELRKDIVSSMALRSLLNSETETIFKN